MAPLTICKTVAAGDPETAVGALAAYSGLPKARIKEAMVKGAVWLKTGRGPRRRIRRATRAIHPGDTLMLFYDADLLALTPPEARCLVNPGPYSVWYKPAGMLSQGTEFGDHCSLLRQAERHLRPVRPYLVHRLDREAAGLMLMAHHRRAAARLSALFQNHRIDKRYHTVVRGRLSQYAAEGVIDLPLDGKTACTGFRATGYDAATDTTTVEIRLTTGRRHQIRRHLAMIGYPVMGDPRYGEHNRDASGMRLTAVEIAFDCPWEKRPLRYALADLLKDP